MSLSTKYPVETLETSSTRPMKKATGSHKFEIMGYSLDEDMSKGQFHQSTIFKVGGYDWCVKYYPNGSYGAADDDVSIFLCLKSKAEGVKAQASFAILDQTGIASPISGTISISTFKTLDHCWGFRSIAKRAVFESNIKDDCFVIKAVVSVFEVFPVEASKPIIVPPGNITQQLGYLLETGNGADVTFKVNGIKFSAHKCILAARSPVFAAQFFGPTKHKSDTVINIEEIEAPVFTSLLHFIYCDSIPEFKETKDSEEEQHTQLMAQRLLVAADRYGLERLKIICEKILYDTIDINSVVNLLSLAQRHNCIGLKAACVKFLLSADSVGEVVGTEEFRQVVKDDTFILKELLEKTRLNLARK